MTYPFISFSATNFPATPRCYSLLLLLLFRVKGAQTRGEYRAQFFLWAVLGAPLIMGNDIRKTDSWTVEVRKREVMQRVYYAVWCVMCGVVLRPSAAFYSLLQPSTAF